MKRFLLGLWLGLIAAVLSPAASGAGRLNLFIWSEYIDPAIVSDFEKKFDCRVVIDLYEDAESMLAKVQAGGTGLYDIVVPPDYMVPAMAKLQLLAPLRPQKIPNLKNLEARFANPPFDPTNRFTAAYQWGTVGIYARKTGGKTPPATWGLLFDPKQQAGPFVLMDSVRDTLGAALKYQGHSLNSVNVDALKQARDLLIATKQRALGFEGGVGGKNKVLARRAALAMAYSGDALRGVKEDTETVYLVPREGSQIWVDNLAVPARAPHRDLAESFINYILEAEIGARLSNYTQFATPNQAARAFIKPDDLKNPAIYPPAELLEKLEFLRDLGNQTRLYDEIWTQIKAR